MKIRRLKIYGTIFLKRCLKKKGIKVETFEKTSKNLFYSNYKVFQKEEWQHLKYFHTEESIFFQIRIGFNHL